MTSNKFQKSSFFTANCQQELIRVRVNYFLFYQLKSSDAIKFSVSIKA